LITWRDFIGLLGDTLLPTFFDGLILEYVFFLAWDWLMAWRLLFRICIVVISLLFIVLMDCLIRHNF